MATDQCRSCRAAIRWVKIEWSGKKMPIDVTPVENGNVLVAIDSSAAVVSKAEADSLREEGYQLFVSHFATCPNRLAHRKK